MKNISFSQKSSLATILLVALTVSPEWLPKEQNTNIVLAQTSEETPAVTEVKVYSSEGMEETSQEYKDRFEASYPDNTANIEIIDSNDDVVKALVDGETEIGAIGRPLTDEEKAAGLQELALPRRKIAIFVGKDNPFGQSITDDQFVKIFRGEIKDWSELGGSPGPIRVIDRPESNGARKALEQYDIFQGSPFESSPDAVKLTDDSIEAVVKELGQEGISYAIYDQVQENQENIKILAMHDTLPDNDKYPFSQPRYFLYKESSPLVAAFLDIDQAPTETPPTETTSTEVTPTEVTSTEVTPTEVTPTEVTPTEVTPTEVTPTATSTTETAQAPPPAAVQETAQAETGGFPWWLLLLPLALLGGLAWFLLPKNKEEETEAAVAPAVAPVIVPPPPLPAPPPSRIILTPRNCRSAYAYWEVPEERKAELKRLGGENLQLRVQEADSTGSQNLQVYDCAEDEQDKHVIIPVDDRDYLAELGYLTDNNTWLSLARSSPVRVPACPPEVPSIMAGAAAAGFGASSVLLNSVHRVTETSRLILVPRDCRSAYAYWEVPAAALATTADEGGQQLLLRLYEVTNPDLETLPTELVAQYNCAEDEQDKHVNIPVDDRDYLAELGYLTDDNTWLSLARSSPVRVPACPPEVPSFNIGETTRNIMAGTAAGVGASSVLLNRRPLETETRRLILVPRDCRSAYAYWEVPAAAKAALRDEGGQQLLLRLYEVINLDGESLPAQTVGEYHCAEDEQDKHVTIPLDDQDYIAELGYLTANNTWLTLARSSPVRVPLCTPTDEIW